jgi:hypothetical protein
MLKEFVFNCISLIFLFLFSSPFYSYSQSTVNPIIGNAGYEDRHQVSVSDTSSEFELIQAHLDYVEKLLREKKVKHLSATQQQNRAKALDLLHTYWKNGQFPINTAYPNERKPCFVDENKTVCAVAYLVEQTAGGELVQQINEQYQYTYIHDMNCVELDKWILNYGFSKNEIATIQPTYYTPKQRNKIKRVKAMRARKAKKHEKKIQEIISYKQERAGKIVQINYKIVSWNGHVKEVHITKGKECLTEKERKKLIRYINRWHIKNSSYSLHDAFVYINFEDPGVYQQGIPYPFEEADTMLKKVQIKGKILAVKSNNPLDSAKIEVKGSSPIVSTLSDSKGNFILSVPKDQISQGEFDLQIIPPPSPKDQTSQDESYLMISFPSKYFKKHIKNIPFNHQKINIKMHDWEYLKEILSKPVIVNGTGVPIDETVYIYSKN